MTGRSSLAERRLLSRDFTRLIKRKSLLVIELRYHFRDAIFTHPVRTGGVQLQEMENDPDLLLGLLRILGSKPQNRGASILA